VPIVTSTGGLKDTVDDCTKARLEKGKATGFVIKDFSSKSMTDAIKKAVKLYKESPSDWKKLMITGMKKDFSWPGQARKYMDLFEKQIKASGKETVKAEAKR
jgi:starch synthase